MQKKSGFFLALALFAFALVSSPAAPLSVGKPLCRCSRDSQCGTGGACCWWPHQTCGICC